MMARRNMQLAGIVAALSWLGAPTMASIHSSNFHHLFHDTFVKAKQKNAESDPSGTRRDTEHLQRQELEQHIKVLEALTLRLHQTTPPDMKQYESELGQRMKFFEQEKADLALQEQAILQVQRAMKQSSWHDSDLFSQYLMALLMGGMFTYYLVYAVLSKYKSLFTPEGRRLALFQTAGLFLFLLAFVVDATDWSMGGTPVQSLLPDDFLPNFQLLAVISFALYFAFDFHRFYWRQATAQRRRRRQRQPGRQQQPPSQRRKRPAAKPYVLETLPVVEMTEDDVKTHGQCPLCFEDFQVGTDDVVRRLPCSHIYHDHCIEPWLLDQNCTCPMCKWEFPTDDEEFNKGQKERMKHRKPRYYRYELNRTSVRELKQCLPAGDGFQAVEKAELFQHLIDIGAIDVPEEETREETNPQIKA